MPCCSDPGTWTGTETPGDMRPVKREADTDTLFSPDLQLQTRQTEKIGIPVLELAEDGVCK